MQRIPIWEAVLLLWKLKVRYPNMYVIQQETQWFMIEFIHNTWWLDMFRTSVVHPQGRLQAVRSKFGMR